jgi:hypothetical protein
MKTVEHTMERYFKKWDTLNNPYYQWIRNMAQVAYSLIYKFYKENDGIGISKIYDGISGGDGELTSGSFWSYIENKGVMGYSRADID